MQLVLLGPQGAGKGTQARRLSELAGVPHIALGDLVRTEVAAETPLGHTLRTYVERGVLVPDEFIMELVRPRILQSSGWILDGYPRTLSQAVALDRILHGAARDIDRVIALEAPDHVVLRRLEGRRHSAATGRTYHLHDNPPPPDDPGPFVQRADDTDECIRRRLEVYHEVTTPVTSYYRNRHLLTTVDACLPIDQVSALIARAIIPEQVTRSA